jgi:hypothetical protein
VGYRTYSDTLVVSAGQVLDKNITLQPRERQLQEIVVGRDTSAADNDPGKIRLETQTVEKLPAAVMPDIFRGLQRLPGVKASSDFSSALYIRGSGPGQTMVQLSGIPIYQSGHLLGFFSVFNPMAVKSATLYKGAYPVEYGGRLGSVVTLETGPANPEELSGRARVGLLASSALVEGPHGHGDWMVAYRRSNMNPVLTALNNRDVEGLPESFGFHDVNAHLTTNLSSEDRLSLTLYRGRDEMYFPYSQNLVFDVSYGNTAGSVRWEHIGNGNFLTRLSATVSRYESGSEALLTRAPFSRQSRILDLSVGGVLEYLPDEPYEVKVGVEGTHQRFRLQDVHGGSTRLERSAGPWRGAVYTSSTVDIGAAWTLDGGIRSTYYSAGRRLRLSPRLGLSYQPASSLRLHAAAGRYHQYVIRTRSKMLSSFDAWLPVGDQQSPSVSDHLTAGAGWQPFDDWDLSVQGYFRRMDNLLQLDPRLPDATGLSYHELFLGGEGFAYGSEVTVEKTAGHLTGNAAYTFATTLQRFPTLNRGRWYAPRHDRRHQLDLWAHARIGSGWGVSAAFTYASGQPHTKPEAQYVLPDSPYMGHNHAVFISRLNASRLPSYRRLDAGVTRRGRLFDTFSYRARLQVVNILSSDNVWFDLYEYNKSYEITRTRIPQIPVPLPAVSLEVQY